MGYRFNTFVFYKGGESADCAVEAEYMHNFHADTTLIKMSVN